MFDTWASYESTRAFVTSSFLLAAPRQSAPFACHARLPYQQVRLLAGLRSAVRVCQLSSRRPLRRHRFPRLRKCLDQGYFRQRDYLRPGVFPPSLGIVRSMLGSLGLVRPAFWHRRSHRRPHVLPRRAYLSRFLQDSPERGKSGLAARLGSLRDTTATILPIPPGNSRATLFEGETCQKSGGFHQQEALGGRFPAPCGGWVLAARRIRPGQRTLLCGRLSPPRSNSSRDDENRPISGRSPL